MPAGISPEFAHQTYLKKKKEMPGLTPAAWRKAAAQELGMDYNDFLAIWKQKQGKSKAVKMVPESVPTNSVAVGPGPAMKVPMKKAASVSDPLQKEFDSTVASLEDAIKTGDLDISDVDDILNDMQHEYQGLLPNLAFKINAAKYNIKAAWKKPLPGKAVDDVVTATNIAETVVEASGKFSGASASHIDTILGPLNHELAQSVYKKMKKEMPGATPATLRHAAAEYLGIDYNDYLAAWKKPGTLTKKQQQIIDKTPQTSTPTSASPIGKYATQPIDADTLKDKLAKAYGPSAQKQYISIVHDSTDGSYKVQFPNSILPTQASKDGVAKALEKLGLQVEKDGSWYKIKAGWKNAKSPAPAVKATNKVIKSDGTYTMPNGTVVWDMNKARTWSNDWWNTLNSAQRAAVKKYTGSGYRGMNSALRRGSAPTTVDKELSSAMNPMDHDFTVFRGTDVPIDEFVKGESWTDKGFMSTAINPGSAWSGVKFEIRITKGTRGAYVDPHSSHQGENEFIIDKGTQMRVLEVDRINRRVVLVTIPK